MDYRFDEYAKMNANQQDPRPAAVDQRYNGGIQGSSQLQPQVPGLRSAVMDLVDAVLGNAGISEELQRSLGIGSAANDLEKPHTELLSEVIRLSAARLRDNTTKLSRCLEHLNG